MKFLYFILPALLFASCKSEQREIPAGATPIEVPEVEPMQQEPVLEEPGAEEEPIAEPPAPTPEAAALVFDVKNADSLVGHTLEGVKPALEAAEIRFRVVEEDGESFNITMDFMPERLNFKIKDGVIIAVSKG